MDKYISVILPFLKKAGKFALKNQTLITGHDKSDGTIVTETDLKISKMFKKLINTNFKNHSILDEETALTIKNLKEEIYKNKYVWIIDPLDGTKAYFNGSALFATAISLFKNREPVFSIIYLPTTKEIIYNNGKSVYLITNAFTRTETKVKLFFQKKVLDKHSLICFPVKNAKDYIKDCKFSFLDVYSAYIYTFCVFKNVAQGAFLKDNVSMWDVYSSLPIAKALGMEIYNVENGKTLEKLDFDLFKENLKVKNMWLICHKDYKKELFSILK